MKKTAAVLIVLTMLSKLLGFGREIVLAYYYGATYISDAYLIATTIPISIFAFVGAAISSSFIPMYSSIEYHEGGGSANQFTSSLINAVLVIALILTIMLFLFTPQIVTIFASGFEGKVLDLTVEFSRVCILGIFFSGITYVLMAYLNIKNDFVTPALMGVPFNLVVILSIVSSKNYDVIFLPYGIVIAMFFQLLFLIPAVLKTGFYYKIGLAKQYKNLNKMIKLSLPIMLGISINQINILVDRTIASRFSSGGITALNYANRLNEFVVSIFVMSFVTVIYPRLSKLAINKDVAGLRKTLSKALNSINILLVPVVIGTMVLSQPIIDGLFGRGAFSREAITMSSEALYLYSIGLIGIGYREVLTRVFFALEDTKGPMVNASLSFTLNIILNIALSRFIGINGLPLATSLSALVCSILLAFNLQKKIELLEIKKILITLTKVLISALLMGTVVRILYNYLIINFINPIALILSIIFGASIYFVLILQMNISEVEEIKSIAISRIR